MYEGGSKAMASLLLTLSALGTKMTERSHLSISNILNKMDPQGLITDANTNTELRSLFDHLLEQIKQSKAT
jgi:hypothetical protein